MSERVSVIAVEGENEIAEEGDGNMASADIKTEYSLKTYRRKTKMTFYGGGARDHGGLGDHVVNFHSDPPFYTSSEVLDDASNETDALSDRRPKVFRSRREYSRPKAQRLERMILSRDETKIRNLIQSKFDHATEAVETAADEPQTQKTKLSKAFGRISFKIDAKSTYEPPYVRLATSDSKEALIDLMTDHWKVPNPKLIVSIVGGARKFEFAKSRIQGLFNQGLLDIAKTTGAWIITPGSYTGLYKMVGSAVKDHIDATGSAAMNEIVLLGIAAWGSVAGKELLEDETGQGKNPAIYPVTEIPVVRGIQPLEPNHSHFILVDDKSNSGFGAELKWRVEFEKFLTDHVLSNQDGETDGVHIPIVTLLVNGGDGSLEACYESLPVNIPLVAIAGSGRAAEVVVLLHKLFKVHYADKNNKPNDGWRPSTESLKEIYEVAMGNEASDSVMSMLKVIADNHSLISVFDFMQSGASYHGDVGLDKAILSALYQKDTMYTGNEDKAANISKRKAQMRLALAWNRVDYARDDILNSNNPDYKEFLMQKEFFYDVALEALIEDMPEFVALFLDHGLDLEKFVTPKRLEKLYQKSMQRDGAFSRMVSRSFEEQKASARAGCSSCVNSVHVDPETKYMHNVGRMLKKLLGYAYPNIYKMEEGSNTFNDDQTHFRDPPQHLFLWAVVFNRMDLATMFWRYSHDHIAGAIVGAAILRGLVKASNDQEGVDIQAAYLNNSQKFEELANGILDLCWCKDRQYTSDMLVRVCHNWGDSTVLSMAYHAEMEEFLAQPACYSKLNKIWRGDISLQTSLWRIIFFAYMPFAVFLLKFVRKSNEDLRMDERQNDPIDLNRKDGHDAAPVTLKPLISVTCSSTSNHQLSYLKAIYRAFTSPIVKCIYYSWMFLTFLAIYSLFLMTELKPFATNSIHNANLTAYYSCTLCCINESANIGCLEIATYCCVLANFLEEVRQIMFRDARSMKHVKQKVKDWFRDTWNKLDLASYIVFGIAIVLRFILEPKDFEWARILFCFSLLIFTVRFSQIFFVVEKLGPKIIMIQKMMVDLIFFLVILSMTILIFGVISQSILHPQSALAWTLINDVIYKPYFQMYGELFLEEFEGYRWILLGLYMILTNILLLNLLIAMFSYTFERVQEKSAILWKYNYYAVVYEHFDRPYIPLVGTLFQMVRHCVCCNLHEDKTDFRRKLDEDLNRKVTKFVTLCMQKYISQQARLKSEDITNKVTNTAHRLELVIEQLDDLREDVVKQQPSSPLSYRPVTARVNYGSTNHQPDSSLKGLESKLETKFKALDGLKSQLESKFGTLETKLTRLEKLESKLDTVMELLQQKKS